MTSGPDAQSVALVTGAASGIGRAVAETLARDGYWVAVNGRSRDRLEALGGDYHPYPGDVSDRGVVRDIFAGIERDAGRLDVLVNCAGVIRGGAFGAITDEDIDYQLGVNLLGTVNMIRAALPLLKAAQGCVVNLSSTLVQRPVPGVAIYAAGKGAIDGLTRALALELAPDQVRVNAVAPALVRSEIWLAAGMDEAKYEKLLADRAREYPLGRVGEPADVAEMVAYLASAKASWITGACIPVDGGSGINAIKR